MKSILLVDDSSMLRNNLKRIISSIPNLQFVGEALDSSTALKLVDELKPDILILDIDLIYGNGIDVLTKIKNDCIRPTTIMFTNYSQEPFKKAATKLGANYFLDKNENIDELYEILKKLASQN